MKYKLFLAAVLFLLPFLVFCKAPIVSDTTFSIASLIADFSIYRDALEEAHPGIYRYTSKVKMDAAFDKAANTINRPMGEREFKLLLSKTSEQIGCGHLSVLAPKLLQDKFDKESTSIPFQLYYDKGQLFVQCNFSNLPDKDFVGARIVSINGHSTKNILKQMFAIMPSDGHNKTYKYRNLSFAKYFTRYLYFLYGSSASYDIAYTSTTAKGIRKKKLAGLLTSELTIIRDKKYPNHYLTNPVEFTLGEDKKTAFLKIESFDGDILEQHKIDLPNFLQSAFISIATNEIKNLVIDLRNNHGGEDELGKLLFSYLYAKDFNYYSSLTTTTDSFAFFKYTRMPGPRVPNGMVKPNSQGTFDIVRHPNVGMQKASVPNYAGKIYVLINGGCFSTASECISMIHSNTRAVFIGEESGGGYYGNNSGMVPEMTLPNTKVRMAIPLMKYVMAVDNYQFNDRGLIPDFVIVPTINDKINGKDPELAFARKLIKQEEINK